MNLSSDNFVAALLALFTLAIPVCGWSGVSGRRRNRGLLHAFWISNAVCGTCYVLGVVLLVAVFIPSVRCVCDPECRSAVWPTDSPSHDDTWTNRGGQLAADSLHHHHPSAGLSPDTEEWCANVPLGSLYASVFLSMMAASAHFASCYYGNKAANAPVVMAPGRRPRPFVPTSQPFYPQQSTLFATPGPGFHPTVVPAAHAFAYPGSSLAGWSGTGAQPMPGAAGAGASSSYSSSSSSSSFIGFGGGPSAPAQSGAPSTLSFLGRLYQAVPTVLGGELGAPEPHTAATLSQPTQQQHPQQQQPFSFDTTSGATASAAAGSSGAGMSTSSTGFSFSDTEAQ